MATDGQPFRPTGTEWSVNQPSPSLASSRATDSSPSAPIRQARSSVCAPNKPSDQRSELAPPPEAQPLDLARPDRAGSTPGPPRPASCLPLGACVRPRVRRARHHRRAAGRSHGQGCRHPARSHRPERPRPGVRRRAPSPGRAGRVPSPRWLRSRDPPSRTALPPARSHRAGPCRTGATARPLCQSHTHHRQERRARARTGPGGPPGVGASAAQAIRPRAPRVPHRAPCVPHDADVEGRERAARAPATRRSRRQPYSLVRACWCEGRGAEGEGFEPPGTEWLPPQRFSRPSP